MGKRFVFILLVICLVLPICLPIHLTAQDFPRPANSVFNAGAAKHGDEYILLNRVEDFEGDSCLWVARSPDGIHFTPDPQPAMVRSTEGYYALYEQYGIEDPRLTKDHAGQFEGYLVKPFVVRDLLSQIEEAMK